MRQKGKKLPRNHFWRFLLIFLCVMALIGAASSAVLWHALVEYEAATPTAAIRRYFSRLEAGDYSALYKAEGGPFTVFEGEAEYEAYLRGLYDGHDLEQTALVWKGEDAAQRSLYAVLDGKTTVARLALIPNTADGGEAWQVKTVTQPLAMCGITAPDYLTVLVNGVPLEEAYCTGRTSVPAYAGLADADAVPQTARYRVEGLLLEPEITAQKPDGTPCRVSEAGETEDGGRAFSVQARPDPGFEAEGRRLAEEAAKTYAAFISEDVSRAALSRLLVPDTEFAARIGEYYAGWYVDHNGYEYRDLTVGDLREYAPDAFGCSVSFTYVVHLGSREHAYPSRYEVVFLNTDDGWRLANLTTQ